MSPSTHHNFPFTWEEAVEWLRKQPGQEQLVKACYYDDPITAAANRFAESEEFTAVLNLFNPKPNSTVLDFGAGRGIGAYGFDRLGHCVTSSHPLHHLYGGEMAYTLSTYLNSLHSAGFRAIKTLGPRESIINALPATLANLENESRSYWTYRLRRLGRWISRSAIARTAALRRLDHQDRQPGRLYSFIAIKPR